MNLIKKISLTIFFGGVVVSLFGCSSTTNQYSPDQVIQNALEEEMPSYYGEVESIIHDQGIETREIMREWRSNDGKTRIELQHQGGSNKTISVNDGHVLTIYEADQNKAYMIDDPEILSFNLSPREQVNMLLKNIRDTHELSTKDGGKVISRDTHHISAKTKKNDTLFGDVELWIDKETWLILKMTLHAGDSVTTTAYTKIDFKTNMSSELFVIDLPEDVEIENMSDIAKTKEISLEDVPSKIGKSVNYFPETEEFKISLVELYELQGELNRNEVSIDYTRNGLPLLTLSVFEKGTDTLDDLPGEIVKVRNHDGIYETLGDVRSLLWQEDGFTYSILLIDPNYAIEELIHLTEKMEAIR